VGYRLTVTLSDDALRIGGVGLQASAVGMERVCGFSVDIGYCTVQLGVVSFTAVAMLKLG
jgi:hypothetical protein